MWAWHATLLQLGLEIILLPHKLAPLNYPLCLTGCHWYTNTPSSRQPGKITSVGPRVFLSLPPPSRLSNHLSAPTVGIKTNPCLLFFFFYRNGCWLWRKRNPKYPAHLCVRGRSDSQTGRCTCVLCFSAVVSALFGLKEAVDHSLETQTVYAVQRTLSISWHQWTNVWCILYVCVLCVWTRESTLLAGQCLMG